MKGVLAVGVGGFAGAIARYAVNLGIGALWTRSFPLATFLINVSGSFLLGFFSVWAAERASVGPALRLLVGTGFVGAYTTFSTFELETERLASGGAMGWAAVNVVASVAAGFVAVRLGMHAAR